MIIQGDCLIEMAKMETNSVDFIVTDSPYGISFMSKDWDKQIPPIEYWQEMLRIVKPGGHLCCAGLPRMIHRLGSIVEDSGWTIRDMIMHIFGSGFPKSHNNFGLPGYGTALKPAWEGWILAMKPLDGTYPQNAEKWGLAGINIDESRIPNLKGRWPANIIFDEKAAEILDEQSGILKSGKVKPFKRNGKNPYSGGFGDNINEFEKSAGGASRFFYCAKTSPKERGNDNNHPTVKPIALMKYIIKLLAPHGNPTLLDPFAGSGSTLLAAQELGINAIGIEKESEYCEIARNRLNNASKEIDKQLNLFAKI